MELDNLKTRYTFFLIYVYIWSHNRLMNRYFNINFPLHTFHFPFTLILLNIIESKYY